MHARQQTGAAMNEARVLAINPGSTSTKIGIYGQKSVLWTETIRHGDEEIERFRGRPMIARVGYRYGLIQAALEKAGYRTKDFVAFAGRGGMLPPLECGTYRVDAVMVAALEEARRGEHASNLGALLALKFAEEAGVEAYIVDPVTCDEWQPQARQTGSPLVERVAIGHVLNTKAVARRYARELGCRYEELRLVVIHLGSGITVSAHRQGRMVDNNTHEDGPFGVDRTGGLPARALARLCFSGKVTAQQVDKHIFGAGGLVAWLGTRDLLEIEQRIDHGDALARNLYEAMIYKVGKEAGAMAAVLEGRVDAVLLTGGMAHSERLLGELRRYISWIAPVKVYPGEDELQALAEGVFRVLNGEEEARQMQPEAEKEGRAPIVFGLE